MVMAAATGDPGEFGGMVEGAQKDWVDDIIAAGGDVNEKDERGVSALIWAAMRGNVAAMQSLLAAPGIDINYTPPPYSAGGRTALIWAAAEGDMMALEMLLNHSGIDVNVGCSLDNRSPLYWAIYFGQHDAFQALLATEGIDVNSRDVNGEVPLMIAVSTIGEGGARGGMAEALLAHPDIDVSVIGREGNSVLMMAIRSNISDQPYIPTLLQMPGLNINAVNEYGETALMMLLDNLRTKSFDGPRQKDTALLSQLLAVPGVNVNAQNDRGETALMFAISKEVDPNLVDILLKSPGIDVNIKNKYGQTALMIATAPGSGGTSGRSWADKHSWEYVQMLLAHPEIDLLEPRDAPEKQAWAIAKIGREKIRKATQRQSWDENEDGDSSD